MQRLVDIGQLPDTIDEPIHKLHIERGYYAFKSKAFRATLMSESDSATKSERTIFVSGQMRAHNASFIAGNCYIVRLGTQYFVTDPRDIETVYVVFEKTGQLDVVKELFHELCLEKVEMVLEEFDKRDDT